MVALTPIYLIAITGTFLGGAIAAPGHATLEARRVLTPNQWRLCAADQATFLKMDASCRTYPIAAAEFGKCHQIANKDEVYSMVVGEGVSCKISTTNDCTCPDKKDCKELKGEAGIYVRQERLGKDDKKGTVKTVQCKKI